MSGSEKSYRPRKLRWRQISGDQAVAEGAGDDDAVQAAELVRQQVVPGHAAGLASMPSDLAWRMASCM
jgi:hypothetical protein